MASRTLARDLFLSKHLFLRPQQLLPRQQVPSSRCPRLQLIFRREFSVFNEFSKKIKGEVERNNRHRFYIYPESETKMMGETPMIIVAATIHTVYYAWAMQQLDPEELGISAPYSMWKLREMQQLGVR